MRHGFNNNEKNSDFLNHFLNQGQLINRYQLRLSLWSPILSIFICISTMVQLTANKVWAWVINHIWYVHTAEMLIHPVALRLSWSLSVKQDLCNRHVPPNLKYKRHQIQKLKCFASRLVVAVAQSTVLIISCFTVRFNLGTTVTSQR